MSSGNISISLQVYGTYKQFLKNNHNLRIKTKSVTAGADATVFENTKAEHLLFHLLQPWQARFYAEIQIIFWYSVGDAILNGKTLWVSSVSTRDIQYSMYLMYY